MEKIKVVIRYDTVRELLRNVSKHEGLILPLAGEPPILYIDLSGLPPRRIGLVGRVIRKIKEIILPAALSRDSNIPVLPFAPGPAVKTWASFFGPDAMWQKPRPDDPPHDDFPQIKSVSSVGG